MSKTFEELEREAWERVRRSYPGLLETLEKNMEEKDVSKKEIVAKRSR